MAKPTDKQKAVLKQLEILVRYFQGTNDIHSPSHSTNIDDLADSLDDELSKETFDALGTAILIQIRKV